MAWTTPPDAINGAIIQASFWNTGGRDNLKYLKGQAGTIVFEAGASFTSTVTVSSGGAQITGGINIISGGLSAVGGVSIGSLDTIRWPQQIAVKEDYTSVGQVLCGVAAQTLYWQADGNYSWRNESGTERMHLTTGATPVLTVGGNTVWHTGNDGAGSGLDADTVDGVQESALAKLASANFSTLQVGGNGVWHSGNDGSGSGLDADLLDGHDTGYFTAGSVGSYVGNGGNTTRQQTLGFVPRLVIISGGTATGNVAVAHVSANGTTYQDNAGNLIPITSAAPHGSDGFTYANGEARLNASGITYTYVAFR